MLGNEIVSLILNDLGIKAPTFANRIGVKYQRILDIQNGKTKKISSALTDKIIERYPQYNRVWLLTGEGEMLRQGAGGHDTQAEDNVNGANAEYLEVIAEYRKLVAQSQAQVSKAQEQIDRLLKIVEQLSGIKQ